jgi:hypothetical protein
LQNLGVTDVVVRSYFFAQNEGGYAYQAFTIEMVSDTPVELKINE